MIPPPPALTLRVQVGGRPAAIVLPGQRVVLSGTLTPAAADDTVTVDGGRDGHLVLSRVVPVRAVTEDGVGHFRLKLHFRRPGQLTFVATHAANERSGDGASPYVGMRVKPAGARRPGCGLTATVVGASRRRPATVGGIRVTPGVRLAPGARLRVPAGGSVRLSARRSIYAVRAGAAMLECDALKLLRGTATVRAPGGARAGVLVGRALGVLRGKGTLSVTAPSARFGYRRGTGFVASSRAPTSRVRAIAGDEVLTGSGGLPRLSTWPFARDPRQRRARPADHLPAFWADGRACSVGCRPAGVRSGWPLKPFHEQHAIRSGFNEWRAANLHIGIDIEAKAGAAAYALQAGTAHIAGRGTSDVHVVVGAYEYWHVSPRVGEGAYVRRGQVVGRVIPAARHLHLSEVRGGAYLNPLRPGGRVLRPWSDHEPPVIGRAHRRGGSVLVEVFDPQSLRITLGYRTPVLAPAAVAWRARDASGHALTSLVFAYRGSQHYDSSARRAIYGPGTHGPDSPAVHSPGWLCFDRAAVCIPKWNYRLAGVPAQAASISVYAWDWDGNKSVLDSELDT